MFSFCIKWNGGRMPYLAKLEQAQEDARLYEQRTGSQTMITGFVILGIAIILSVYNFADIREGTHLMLAMSGGLGLVGLILIGIGEHRRGSAV
jgi:hypothetical protein